LRPDLLPSIVAETALRKPPLLNTACRFKLFSKTLLPWHRSRKVFSPKIKWAFRPLVRSPSDWGTKTTHGILRSPELKPATTTIINDTPIQAKRQTGQIWLSTPN
jgi:hypothetical protein